MLSKANKKYVVFIIWFIIFGAVLAAGLALKKHGLRKVAYQYQPGTVAKLKSETAQPTETLQPQPSYPDEQSDAKTSGDSLKEPDKDKMLSAAFKLVAGHRVSDKLSEEELITILSDREASIKDRRQAAWTLAKSASKKALRTLEQFLFLPDSPASIKAAVVEGLGYSSDPQAKELIVEALKDEDDIVVRGAIRGLSLIGDEGAITILSNFINSADATGSVVAEAAIGLGNIDHPDAYNALIEAYESAEKAANADLQYAIITGLGQRDISETAEFFQNIMDQNQLNPTIRLAAVKAFENAQGTTGSFFLSSLNDGDPEVRAEAAWALALAEDPGNFGSELQGYLTNEGNAEVRKHLYQALDNQEDADIDAIGGIVFEEADMEARLAGYDFLAKNIGSSKNEILREQFEKKAIPELQRIALSGESLNLKLSAVIALKRAGTERSFSALEQIAEKSSDPNVLRATGLD